MPLFNWLSTSWNESGTYKTSYQLTEVVMGNIVSNPDVGSFKVESTNPSCTHNTVVHTYFVKEIPSCCNLK